MKEILGPEMFYSEVAERTEVPGVATGLAWTAAGGDLLFIEATKMAGKGGMTLTGQLGDVMKESATAALSYLRSKAEVLGINPNFLEKTDLHLHFPAGSIPKDGPSAGVTILTALTSLLTGIRVRGDTAMTGEATLRGLVLPVGGIKEKVLAAHRAGIKRVILPGALPQGPAWTCRSRRGTRSSSSSPPAWTRCSRPRWRRLRSRRRSLLRRAGRSRSPSSRSRLPRSAPSAALSQRLK